MGSAVVLLILGSLIGCSLSASWPLRSCVRSALHGVVSELLLFASMLLGGWLGWETGTAFRRQWLGWIAGIASALALGFFFMWLGFEPHVSELSE
ncbi:hypothetical protein GmRootV116_26160 [Variovorax sp. V116]